MAGCKFFPSTSTGAVDVVMQFRPHAQQEIVGGLQLPALGLVDEFVRLQFRAASGCGI